MKDGELLTLYKNYAMLLAEVCHAHGVTPGEVTAGSRRKTKKIAEARRVIAETLRTSVWVDSPAKPKEFRYGERPGRDWFNISYPMIGKLLGLDHTSVMLSLRRTPLAERMANA